MDRDDYFMTAVRYIHRNPVKAGIAASPTLYPYSSYAAYLSGDSERPVDTQKLLALIPKEEIAAWHERDDKARCLDVDERAKQVRISDEKVVQVMRKVSGAANLEAFLQLPDQRRADAIRRMHEAGVSLRQIVRLTGTSLALVRKSIVQATSVKRPALFRSTQTKGIGVWQGVGQPPRKTQGYVPCVLNDFQQE